METPENGQKRTNMADNARIPPTTPGVAVGMLDDRLMEVSLVREPANPHCRILRVGSDEDQEC